MGRVYRAWDPRLKRGVALKFIQSGSRNAAQRFIAEAQAQAQVAHPHVCAVYETGEVDGNPYIAMELIEGPSLETAGDDLDLRTKLTLARNVALALHAAHLRGLIHRDVKPSNIMLGPTGDGRLDVKVVDFGLSIPFLHETRSDNAEDMGDEAPTIDTPARRWQVAGTPSYMAPEQALGLEDRLDARTDVYALGCTLYELLLGRPPLTAGTTMELLLKVMSEEPPRPRTLDPSIPAEVEAIVLKCLRKDARDRYQTALELSRDLEAYLEGRPVSAFGGGPIYRLGKRFRQFPALSLMALVLLLATGLATGMWIRTAWRSKSRAAAAQEFGHSLAELDAMLWKIRSLPVHDIGPDSDLIHDTIDRTRDEIERRGSAARGPGYSALGVAYLHLGEVDSALVFLKRALEAGFDTPDVNAAMGLALGRIYQRSLVHTRGIADENVRRQEYRRIEHQYRDRALSFLAHADGSTVTPVPYVEGFLALLEERFDEGLREAENCLHETPWHYQAKLLEADLLAGKADVAETLDDALTWFDRALGAIDEALIIAPSDQRCHLQRARTGYRRALAIDATGKSLTEDEVDSVQEAARTALEIDGDTLDAHLVLADLYRMWADQHRVHSLGDPWPWIEKAKIEVTEAARIEPENPDVLAALGDVHRVAAKAAVESGRDPEPFLETAVESLRKSVGIEGSYARYNSLGIALRRIAAWRSRHGDDPRPDLEEAAGAFGAATSIDPTFPHAWSNLAWVRLNQAQWADRNGADPTKLLEDSIATFQRALECEDSAIVHNNLGMALSSLARHRIFVGEDAHNDLEQAADSFRKAIELMPGYSFAYNNLGDILIETARYEIERAVVADTLLDQAEEALAVAAERRGYSSPWFNRGLMFLLQARIFETRGKDPTPALRQSVEAFQTGLELRPGVAGALTGLARAHFEIAQAAGELTGFTRAAQALDQSLEQDPTVAESWSLGALVTTFGPRKESTLVRDPIAAADRALEIDPTDPTVLKDCLLTCLELRRQNRREEDSAPLCDRTVSLSSDSLELRPNDTELRLLLRLLDGNSSSDPAGQSPIGELIEGNHRLRSRYGRFLGA